MSEAKIQSDSYLWFHEKYPEYRGLLCYNLNNSRSKIQAMTDRALGLQPGRSDLVLYFNSKAYMLEAKTETGTQEPNQKVWEAKIIKAGFTYQIFRSKEEFISLIVEIIK